MAVYYNDEGDLKLLAGSTMYADNPIGSILPYGGTTAPNGWFLCQGQALSRTEYSDLFKAIGTSFGAGDSSTTFNIPDLRGEFLRGAGTNSHTNQGNGGTVGQHQDGTEMPQTYTWGGNQLAQFTNNNTPDNLNNSVKKEDSNVGGTTTHTFVAATTVQSGTWGNVNSFTARPTNTSVNYIIKAKHVAIPADFMNKVEEIIALKSTPILRTVSSTPFNIAALSYTEVTTDVSYAGYKPICANVVHAGYAEASVFGIQVSGNNVILRIKNYQENPVSDVRASIQVTYFPI